VVVIKVFLGDVQSGEGNTFMERKMKCQDREVGSLRRLPREGRIKSQQADNQFYLPREQQMNTSNMKTSI
jgi:hypothetical protein